MNFEVHFFISYKVSTRSGFGVTIYLGITRVASHTFYNFILLL